MVLPFERDNLAAHSFWHFQIKKNSFGGQWLYITSHPSVVWIDKRYQRYLEAGDLGNLLLICRRYCSMPSACWGTSTCWWSNLRNTSSGTTNKTLIQNPLSNFNQTTCLHSLEPYVGSIFVPCRLIIGSSRQCSGRQKAWVQRWKRSRGSLRRILLAPAAEKPFTRLSNKNIWTGVLRRKFHHESTIQLPRAFSCVVHGKGITPQTAK